MKNSIKLVDFYAKIQELELQKEQDLLALKAQFTETYEALKPLNFIKNSLGEILESSDLKTDIFNATLGITSGFVAKKVIIGETHNPISQLAGNVLEMVVANKVFKNAEGIKSIGTFLIQKIFQKKEILETEE